MPCCIKDAVAQSGRWLDLRRRERKHGGGLRERADFNRTGITALHVRAHSG
jgi:hypothetical protein